MQGNVSIVGDPVDYQMFLSNSRQWPRCEGERRLLLAVLEDAIITYQTYAFDRYPPFRQKFAEVNRWLDMDSDHLYSFRSICEYLKLDHRSIRDGLRKWKKQHESQPG